MDAEQAQRDLDLIKQMVQETRRDTRRFGDLYVVWGIGILLAMALQWWLSRYTNLSSSLPWLVMLVLVTLYWSLTRGRRGGEHVVSYGSRVAKEVWRIILVGLVAVNVLASTGHLPAPELMPLACILIGIGMAAMGALFRSWVFRAAGVLWLAGSVAGFLWPIDPVQTALFAGLMVAGYIAPGLWLMLAERATDG